MYLLFDIGGSNIRFATSHDQKEIKDFLTFPTPQTYDEASIKLREVILQLTSGETIDAVGGGVAGVLSKDKSYLLRSPHLKEWENRPLKKLLEELTRCEVILENDSALCGLGEAAVEERKIFKHIVYLTVSTGFGGVNIYEGKIVNRLLSFEPGFQIIGEEGASYTYLEDQVSGDGLAQKYGVQPSEIKDSAIWDQVARSLAVALNNTIVYWSPELIVLGGGLIYKNAIPFEKTLNYLHDAMKIFPELPIIEKAVHGNRSGVLGALAYLNSRR